MPYIVFTATTDGTTTTSAASTLNFADGCPETVENGDLRARLQFLKGHFDEVDTFRVHEHRTDVLGVKLNGAR